VARALVNRPSLLLCDEPTGNLDTATTSEFSDLLAGLHRDGTTILISTHNPGVAERAGRRISLTDGYLTAGQDPLPEAGESSQLRP
jgi:putative ABC transport system ATP-binding protein